MNIEELIKDLANSSEDDRARRVAEMPLNSILTELETAEPILADVFKRFCLKSFNVGDIVTQHTEKSPFSFPKKGELAIVIAVTERKGVDDDGEMMEIFRDITLALEIRNPGAPVVWCTKPFDSRFLELVKPASEVFPDGLPNGIISSALKESADR